jgi:hypothetical protein
MSFAALSGANRRTTCFKKQSYAGSELALELGPFLEGRLKTPLKSLDVENIGVLVEIDGHSLSLHIGISRTDKANFIRVNDAGAGARLQEINPIRPKAAIL